MQAQPKVQLDFIDALRGLAIVGVLLSHAQRNVEIYQAMGHQALMSPWLSRYAAQGARGVQLFFVVSALTLFLSAGKRTREDTPWLNFYVRRVFRIAPMFYLAFGVYCLAPVLLKGQALPPLGTVLGTLSFTNGWNPAWLLGANDVVPGGWSIGVEMSFYIVFPLVFLALRSFPRRWPRWRRSCCSRCLPGRGCFATCRSTTRICGSATCSCGCPTSCPSSCSVSAPIS